MKQLYCFKESLLLFLLVKRVGLALGETNQPCASCSGYSLKGIRSPSHRIHHLKLNE